MRVLHTPQNIASLPSHTVRGLRAAGVDATGIIYSNAPIQSADGVEVISSSKKPVSRLVQKMIWLLRLIRASRRFDVLHWYYGKSMFGVPLDLVVLKALHKPMLVEYSGSDIRVPEVEFAENPYYTQAFRDPGYEYRLVESKDNSRRHQAAFAWAGFAAGADRGMQQYIDRSIHPHPYVIPRRVVLADYPWIGVTNRARPLVVHSPSARVAKGTAAVLKAVEALQRKLDFDFQLIVNMPRAEAMAAMQTADIFLDQFVLGDYGMASVEAMAFGKPVICYIKPSLVEVYGPDLPIVNATQDNLSEVLEQLLLDAPLRKVRGQLGRRYVETQHDMQVIVPRLQQIYQELVA